MPYALLIVDKPVHRPWPDGLDFYTRKLPIDEGLIRVAENSWLIRLDTDLLALANIVVFASKAKYPLRAMFFDKKPDLVSWEPTPQESNVR